VLGLLQQLNRTQSLTIIIITHNPAIAEIAHRVIRLVSGRIAESTVNEHPIEASEVTW
jgi:putative ABC transport system ATP-binding protein